MNEEILLRWAAGKLDPAEEMDVYRWMVRCTDPNLPILLQGMLRAQRDAVADQQLGALGGVWARIVAGWNQLLDAGQAEMVSLESGLQFASADEQPWARVVAAGDALTLEVARDGFDVEAFITTDRPSLDVVTGWSGVPVERVALLSPGGPRPTLWVFRHPTGFPDRDPEALLQSDAERLALRWVEVG